MAEMGRQFICPGAAEEEVASDYPKVYLQVKRVRLAMK